MGGAWARWEAVLSGSARGVFVLPFLCGWLGFLIFGDLFFVFVFVFDFWRFAWRRGFDLFRCVGAGGPPPSRLGCESGRVAPPWPCTCSRCGRWSQCWTPRGGRAWQAVPRWVGEGRRARKRGPCVRVRAVCGAGACCGLPCCPTTRMVYLARRNAVAGVWQTMAWVRCALWREGRWCEIGGGSGGAGFGKVARVGQACRW